MPVQSLNLLVFRDGTRLADGRSLKIALTQQVQLLDGPFQSVRTLDALLLAGELESALADCDTNSQKFSTITDALAAAVVNSEAITGASPLLAILDATHVPEKLSLSVPEGFAYYALHPLVFADVLDHLPISSSRAAVVGIRTIGATLSAVTAAALRKRGFSADRITVRPMGHPYNRHTRFSPQQMDFVRQEIAAGSSFLVVDEGPGLSGSSFLSGAEALVQAGVNRESITLICSHAPQFDYLCAENAAQRGRQFRWVAVPQEVRRPCEAQVWIDSGQWRPYFIPQESSWPASWLNFERLKYLSAENAESRFYKFLGLGHYGREVLHREARLAASGFAVSPRIESEGFGSYPFVKGRPMSAADTSESALARLAACCASRLHLFAAVESVDLAAMQQMAEHNLEQLRFDVSVNLQLERPVIADGRMQPHEWLLTGAGQMLKTDSGSHGDDHFFPGTVDIAWDLAGAIVEWQMTPAVTKAFLELYRRASGDDAEKRIAGYITAYTVFRCAYCLMAANAIQGTEEHRRLEKAAAFYRSRLPFHYQLTRPPSCPFQRMGQPQE
ncbi:MAG TPA: hypothetical protein VI685_24510 [Candidatus Angelobacter sp.]